MKRLNSPGVVLLLFAIYIGYESSLIEAGAEFGMGGLYAVLLSVGLGITAAALLVRAVALPHVSSIRHFTRPGGGYGNPGTRRLPACHSPHEASGYAISLAIITAVTMPVFGARTGRQSPSPRSLLYSVCTWFSDAGSASPAHGCSGTGSSNLRTNLLRSCVWKHYNSDDGLFHCRHTNKSFILPLERLRDDHRALRHRTIGGDLHPAAADLRVNPTSAMILMAGFIAGDVRGTITSVLINLPARPHR